MTDPRDKDPKAPEEDTDKPLREDEDSPVDLPEPLVGPDVSLPV
jgi:hypothetical protein